MSLYRRILVVTPTLGTSAFLEKTMDSVATQLLDIVHVISAPSEKHSTLQTRFPHARVVADNGKSGGIYGAINAGLNQTNVEWDWFTYINDDDLLLPGFSEMFYRHMRSGASEPVIYGDVELIDETTRVISRVTTERDPSWIPALLQQGISPLMQQGTLFRRDVVQALNGFDLRYRLCADLDFWLRAYANGAKFRYYPKRVAQFRLRTGQLSGSTSVTEREQSEIVKRHLPVPVAGWSMRFARWRYRVFNLPRYVQRTRARGLRTSYQLLQGNTVQQ